jgi:hypothetical protein
MINRTFLLAVAMVVVVFSAESSFGAPLPLERESDNINIGVFAVQTSFTGGLDKLGTGDGLGFRLGFSDRKRIIMWELAAFQSKHDVNNNEDTVTGYTTNIRLSLPVSDILRPYGFVGVGKYSFDTSKAVYRDKQFFNGYQGGGGFDVILSQYMVLYIGYSNCRLSFNQGTPANGKLKGGMNRTDLGFTFLF